MTIHPVRKFRKEVGFSVDELAEYTGLAAGTIRGIENGSSRFKTNEGVALILADAFGCKISDLFAPEELSHLGRPPLTGTSITASFSLSVTHEGVTETYTVTHKRSGNICPVCFVELPIIGICGQC